MGNRFHSRNSPSESAPAHARDRALDALTGSDCHEHAARDVGDVNRLFTSVGTASSVTWITTRQLCPHDYYAIAALINLERSSDAGFAIGPEKPIKHWNLQ